MNKVSLALVPPLRLCGGQSGTVWHLNNPQRRLCVPRGQYLACTQERGERGSCHSFKVSGARGRPDHCIPILFFFCHSLETAAAPQKFRCVLTEILRDLLEGAAAGVSTLKKLVLFLAHRLRDSDGLTVFVELEVLFNLLLLVGC